MEEFLVVAAFVTKAVDFIRNAVDPDVKLPAWVWNLTAFAVAAGTNVFVGIDLVGNRLVTALAIGAAAGGFHEVFDFFSSVAKGAKR